MSAKKKQLPNNKIKQTQKVDSATGAVQPDMASFLENAAFCVFYVTIVGIVLLYSWETKSNFIMPKTWVFEPAMTLVALLLGASVFLRRRVELTVSKVYIPATVFLLICALSIVKSRVPYEGEKALRFLIFAALSGFLTANMATTRFRLRALVWGMIAVGCVESVWGIAQKSGYDPILHLTVDSVGTLGNSNYLGALLGVLLPITLGFGIAEYMAERDAGRKAIKAGAGVASFLIIAVGLVISECQGAYLGAAGAVVAITIVWFIKSSKEQKRLMGIIFAAIPGIIALAVIVASLMGKAPIKRFAHLGDRAVGGRVLMWEVSMNMVHDHPLFGIGIGNYQRNYLDYLAATVKQKDVLAIRNIIQNEEKPHNAYVQYWSETGSLGLAALLAMLGVFFWGRIRVLLKISNPADLWTHVGLTAGFFSFCAILFVSSLMVIAPFREYFWVFMGYVIAWENIVGLSDKPKFMFEFDKNSDWKKWAVLALGVLLPFVWFFYATYNSARAWKADALWQQAIDLTRVNKISESIEVYDRALEIIPRDMKLLFYRGSAMIRLSEMETDPDKRKALLEEGANDLLRAREGYADVNLDSNIAKAYSDLGRYDEAVEYYKTAAATGLKIDNAYANLGIAYILASRYEDAVKALQTSLAVKPDSMRANYNFGVALLKLHRASEAEKVFRKIVDAAQSNPDIFTNLGLALLEQKKATEAMDSFNKALAIEPNSTRARNSLAESLWQIGRKSEAIEQWRKVLEIDPQNNVAGENIKARANGVIP